MKKVVFEDLVIYKEARRYRKRLRKIAKSLPKKERDRLGYDLIDSSRAISTIIAKGNASSIAENVYCCETAIAFASETMDMLIIAYDEGYIKKSALNKYRRWYKKLVQNISRYLVFLRKQSTIVSKVGSKVF